MRQQLTGFECPARLLSRTNSRADLRSEADLVDASPQTNIIINCLPGSAGGFFPADLVAAMAPSSIYASMGRGNTTDEPALITALEAGHFGRACST